MTEKNACPDSLNFSTAETSSPQPTFDPVALLMDSPNANHKSSNTDDARTDVFDPRIDRRLGRIEQDPADLANSSILVGSDVASSASSLALFGIEDMGPIAESTFNEIDTDRDGYVNPAEARAAADGGRYKGEKWVYAQTLKTFLPALQLISNDELGMENDGVTRADLKEFIRQYTSMLTDSNNGRLLRTAGKEVFNQIDTDGSGVMTSKELNSAAQDPEGASSDDGHDRDKAIQLMKTNFDEIQAASDDGSEKDGITKEDLELYFDSRLKSYPVTTLAPALECFLAYKLEAFETEFPDLKQPGR